MNPAILAAAIGAFSAPTQLVIPWDGTHLEEPARIRAYRPRAPRRPLYSTADAPVQFPLRGVPAAIATRRPYSIFARKPLTTEERSFATSAAEILRDFADDRPQSAPNDCRPGMPRGLRPCPWASCRYHLGVTVNDAGSIKVDHGHLNFELLEDTCAIDVAQRGAQTQARVAALTGVTEDRIRQQERELLRIRLPRKARALVGETHPRRKRS